MIGYRAYGLGILSEIELPELPQAERPADVVIRRGRVDAPRIGSSCYRFGTDVVSLFWPDVGCFLIRNGREIVVDPALGVDERLIRLDLLGMGLGVLLHQRGDLALHAGSVAVDGQAIIFLGNAGRGKSTLAAACYRLGAQVLSDDLTLVQFSGDSPFVVPGFPRIKLFPESLRALGYDPRWLPRIHPTVDKRGLAVEAGFPGAPIALGRVYVLEEGAQGVSDLSGQEAFMGLVRNTFAARLLPGLGLSRHFQQCSALVARTVIRRLCVPRELSSIARVARRVLSSQGASTFI